MKRRFAPSLQDLGPTSTNLIPENLAAGGALVAAADDERVIGVEARFGLALMFGSGFDEEGLLSAGEPKGVAADGAGPDSPAVK